MDKTEEYIEICKKCGKKYIPHLIKPLTICDACFDKLTEDCKNLTNKNKRVIMNGNLIK